MVNLDGAHLNGADLSGADLTYASLRKTMFMQANLRGADLSAANLSEAHLSGTNLSLANFTVANLRGAMIGEANLEEADLAGANLSGAKLHGAYLYGAYLGRVRGAERAHALETVMLTQQSGPHALFVDAATRSFETCLRPWPERWLDWERLRVVGRLPLFGISYTALILIPLVFYGLALYNDKVDLIRAWAAQAVISPDHPPHRFAPLLLERLHPHPLPSQSLLLLVSTRLLAAGSTLYTFFSPSRIKEFSRDQWCDQLGRSLLHYWPLAWKHRSIRLACAACYALGGAGAFWVLGTKVWQTALFIVKHSTFPWPWR